MIRPQLLRSLSIGYKCSSIFQITRRIHSIPTTRLEHGDREIEEKINKYEIANRRLISEDILDSFELVSDINNYQFSTESIESSSAYRQNNKNEAEDDAFVNDCSKDRIWNSFDKLSANMMSPELTSSIQSVSAALSAGDDSVDPYVISSMDPKDQDQANFLLNSTTLSEENFIESLDNGLTRNSEMRESEVILKAFFDYDFLVLETPDLPYKTGTHIRIHYKSFLKYRSKRYKLPEFPYDDLTEEALYTYIKGLCCYDYSSFISNKQLLKMLVTILSNADKYHSLLSTRSINHMIRYFIRMHRLDLSSLAFDTMVKLGIGKPNIATCNALLMGIQIVCDSKTHKGVSTPLLDNGKDELVCTVFNRMKKFAISPDNSTFLIMYDLLDDVESRLKLLKLMMHKGVCLNDKIFDIMSDLYSMSSYMKEQNGEGGAIVGVEEFKNTIDGVGILSNLDSIDIDTKLLNVIIWFLLYEKGDTAAAFQLLKQNAGKIQPDETTVLYFTKYFVTNGKAELWNCFAAFNYFIKTYPELSSKFTDGASNILRPALFSFQTHPFAGCNANVNVCAGIIDKEEIMHPVVLDQYVKVYKNLIRMTANKHNSVSVGKSKKKGESKKRSKENGLKPRLRIGALGIQGWKSFKRIASILSDKRIHLELADGLTKADLKFKNRVLNIMWDKDDDGLPIVDSSSDEFLKKAKLLGKIET